MSANVYLIAADESYGTSVYDSLVNGNDPDQATQVDDYRAMLFSLPLYAGESTANTTMKVERGNAPFDLRGNYRLVALTDSSSILATVREFKSPL